jgi:hypothetical protein
MARIKIEGILEHLDGELSRALEDTLRRAFPDSKFNARNLYRDFVRAADRKCSTWEQVPDRYIEND